MATVAAPVQHKEIMVTPAPHEYPNRTLAMLVEVEAERSPALPPLTGEVAVRDWARQQR